MNNTISVRFELGKHTVEYGNGYKVKGKVSTIIKKITEMETEKNQKLSDLIITSHYFTEEMRTELFTALRKRGAKQ